MRGYGYNPDRIRWLWPPFLVAGSRGSLEERLTEEFVESFDFDAPGPLRFEDDFTLADWTGTLVYTEDYEVTTPAGSLAWEEVFSP